jgi:hypothetical protein
VAYRVVNVGKHLEVVELADQCCGLGQARRTWAGEWSRKLPQTSVKPVSERRSGPLATGGGWRTLGW